MPIHEIGLWVIFFVLIGPPFLYFGAKLVTVGYYRGRKFFLDQEKRNGANDE